MARSATNTDPCWAAYPNTVLEIGEGPLLTIDLRLPLIDAQRHALRDLGLGPCFAIVTACNPGGLELSASQNADRGRQLGEEIRASEVASLPADGVSVDSTHRETGYAVGVEAARAIAWAAAHGQSAIFWFDGMRFSILPVLEPGAAPIDLPVNNAAQATREHRS